MKKYSAISNAYKNQPFSKAVHAKYNLIRINTIRKNPELITTSNYVAS
jgi:hypothetical protein